MCDSNSGTIKAYLGTFEKFLTFVVEERVRSTMLQVSTDAKRVFRNVIPKLKGWRKTVDIDMRPQQTQRILNECENRLTNEDVEQFHCSKHVLKISLCLRTSPMAIGSLNARFARPATIY